MKSFDIEVVTPDTSALKTEATSLQVPAWEGYLGVLANHAPLLAVLKAGVVTVKQEESAQYYAIRGGFMEVADNRVVVLADDFVEAAKLDRGAIERALDQAKAPPADVGGADAAERLRLKDLALAERDHAIAWAEARLKALDLRDGV